MRIILINTNLINSYEKEFLTDLKENFDITFIMSSKGLEAYQFEEEEEDLIADFFIENLGNPGFEFHTVQDDKRTILMEIILLMDNERKIL